MNKDKIQNALVELYAEFEADIMQAEKDGRGHYTDNDFDFRQFMRWLIVNNP